MWPANGNDDAHSFKPRMTHVECSMELTSMLSNLFSLLNVMTVELMDPEQVAEVRKCAPQLQLLIERFERLSEQLRPAYECSAPEEAKDCIRKTRSSQEVTKPKPKRPRQKFQTTHQLEQQGRSMKPKPIQEPMLIDLNGIATLLRVSSRTARRLVREHGFPPRVRLRGCIRWWKCDVLDHVRKITGDGGPMTSQN